MKNAKRIVKICFLLFVLFQLFGLVWLMISSGEGELTEREAYSIEAYLIYFVWSIVTIPIVLWARKWGRVQFWYWISIFWFFITPIILLLIKGKNKSREDLKELSFFHFDTIINYLFINFIFTYFYTSASVRGYPAHIGGGSGIIFITIGYLIFRLINRKKENVDDINKIEVAS